MSVIDPGFGLRLRARRKELKWTLDQLGLHAGLSVPFLSDLERGKRCPGADTLRKLSEATGVTMAALYQPDGPAPPADPSLPVMIPSGLASYAESTEMGYRDMVLILELGKVIARYKKKDVDSIDWARLSGAIQRYMV